MKSGKSLTITYVVTILVCTFLAVWIGNGYAGAFNSNFSGGFQRLNGQECYPSSSSECRLELPKNENYKLLVGDSEAVSISDLFKDGMGNRTYVGALTACPFIPKSIIRESMTKQCRDLVDRNFQIVFGATCGDIYIFNRFRPENESEQSSYFSFLRQIAKSCQHLTLIGTPIELIPRFNAYSSIMFRTAINAPSVFKRSDFDGRSIVWNSVLSDFFRKPQNLPNMNYINTNEIVVTRLPTSLRDSNGEYLYTDSTHLSKYGGEMIMAQIRQFVEPSLIL